MNYNCKTMKVPPVVEEVAELIFHNMKKETDGSYCLDYENIVLCLDGDEYSNLGAFVKGGKK